MRPSFPILGRSVPTLIARGGSSLSVFSARQSVAGPPGFSRGRAITHAKPREGVKKNTKGHKDHFGEGIGTQRWRAKPYCFRVFKGVRGKKTTKIYRIENLGARG